MQKKLFTSLELKRYHRQMIMDGWGERGQEKLKKSTVFIAGAGGLGSPVAIYLAAAGVGKLRICDFDTLEISNLNRQILHTHTRIGKYKALSAKTTLKRINPHIEIEAFYKEIKEDNIAELADNCQVLVDCLDNFPTRYVLNKFAIEKRLVLVHGSIWGWEGRLTTVHFPHTPCLSCVFPASPPPGVFPVVGVTPGIIGCLQAAEVIKSLLGMGDNLYNQLLTFSGTEMNFKKLKTRVDASCEVCAQYRK